MLELSLLTTEVTSGSSAELLKRVRFESENPIQGALDILKGFKTELTAFITDEAFIQFIDAAASRNDYQIIVTELLSLGINMLLYEVPDDQVDPDSIEQGMIEYMIIDSKFLEYPFAQKIVVPEGTKLSQVMKQIVDAAGMTDADFKTAIERIIKSMTSDEDTIGHISTLGSEWLIKLMNKAGIEVYSVVDAMNQ